ncbi:MAG TPA: hypothetical protein VJ912_04340 [Candidatus Nanoarchaeia archaeon]|nr:hypothetical protein [Candidatus Nanoarchaeia archaeon]
MKRVKKTLIFLLIVIGVLILLNFIGVFNFLNPFFEMVSNNFGIGLEDMVYFKYGLAILIFLAIFYILNTAQIPDSKAVRLILSLAIGFLAIFFITKQALYSIFQSYVGLFFTMVAALIIGGIVILIEKIFPKKQREIE